MIYKQKGIKILPLSMDTVWSTRHQPMRYNTLYFSIVAAATNNLVKKKLSELKIETLF